MHVYEVNHPEIELNVKFRDYLLKNEYAREEYQTLKIKLLKEDKSFEKEKNSFSGYNLGKDTFIRNIISNLDLKGLRFLRATHYIELNEYHRIKKEQIFDRLKIVYDKNHPSNILDNYHHFILCSEAKIVAVAMVEFSQVSGAILRILAVDNIYQNKGYGKHMLYQVEKWVKKQGYLTIKLHGALHAERFYQKIGYKVAEFDDIAITPDTIKLEKNLSEFNY